MRETLFQAICRVGIFMICAQALIHFKPSEAYEKYLRLIVSVMVLIQLFLPVGSIFASRGRAGMARQLQEFRESLEEGQRFAQEQAAETDRILEQMTLEEVQRLLEEQRQQQAEEGTDTADADTVSGEQNMQHELSQVTEAENVTSPTESVTIEIEPIEQIAIQGDEE